MSETPPDSNETLLEIQFHPSNIRRGVKVLFLTRRQLKLITSILAVMAAYSVACLLAAPGEIRDLLSRRHYRSLMSERARQGDRLVANTSRLEELAGQTEHLRLRMDRIFLTYGLEADDSIGQGGYPFSEGEPIVSIYAETIQGGRRFQSRISEHLAVLEAFIGEVQSFEAAHETQVRTTPSISPLPDGNFVLTSPFGMRRSPFTKSIDSHPGIDLAATAGLEIRAPADGVVVFAGRYPVRQSVAWWRYGNMVAVRHGDRFITLFGHCDEVKVRQGQKVEQGDTLATVGNTGWSTSPHLHYEIRRLDEAGDFRPVDPRIYILDHRWRDEERLLVRARRAPDLTGFEPLPRLIGR